VRAVLLLPEVGDAVPHLSGQSPRADLPRRPRPILHLEASLHDTVVWANANNKRWAFTLSNAGSYYFEDRADLGRLCDINWDAVQANKWSGPGVSGLVKEGKQAEFLIEEFFPWSLVSRIGVHSRQIHNQVANILRDAAHKPAVQIMREWYY
jgi:hypothetical protein